MKWPRSSTIQSALARGAGPAVVLAAVAATVYAAANYAPLLSGNGHLPAVLLRDLIYIDAGTMARHAARLLFAGATAAVFVLSGRALLPIFTRGGEFDPIFAGLVSFALGGGMAAFALAWLALAHAIGPRTIAAVFAALLLGGAAFARRGGSVGAALRLRPPSLSAFATGFSLLAALALLAHFLVALSPPVEVDEMTYHLLGPKMWLRADGFCEIASLSHTYLQSHVEMFYLAALGLADDLAAKLLQSAVWVATGLAVYRLARRGAGRRAAALVALAFATMPLVNKCGGSAYVDLSLTFYTLLALEAALLAAERRDVRLFYLASLLAGMALATKWYGVNAVLLTLGIAAVDGFFIARAPATVVLRRLLAGGLLSSLPVLPYLIRNFCWTGNPAYPLADALFHSHAWARGSWLSFYMLQGGRWSGQSVAGFFFPWLGLTPLLLLAPALWAAAKNRRMLLTLGVFSAYAALVAVQGPVDRFFFPVFGALAAAGAVGTDLLPRRGTRAFMLLLFSLAVVFNAWLTVVAHHDRLPVVVNDNLREQFLRQKLANYEMVAWINEHHRPDDVFFALDTPEYYYYEASFICGITSMRRVIDYPEIRSPEDFVRRLGELKATHVVLTPNYKSYAAFDARLKKMLGLSADAWTYDGAFLASVQQLVRSPYLQLVHVSSDGQALLTKIVYPPAAPGS